MKTKPEICILVSDNFDQSIIDKIKEVVGDVVIVHPSTLDAKDIEDLKKRVGLKFEELTERIDPKYVKPHVHPEANVHFKKRRKRIGE